MKKASDYAKNFAAGFIGAVVMFGPALCVAIYQAYK